jgi:hypothetical protein
MIQWDKEPHMIGEAQNAIGRFTDTAGVRLSGPLTGWKNMPGRVAAAAKNINNVDEDASAFVRGAQRVENVLKVGSEATLKPLAKTLINGRSVVVGAAAISGLTAGWQEYNKAHMGQIDPYMTKPTARTPYLDNAGATGDLVFAMNANRRG